MQQQVGILFLVLVCSGVSLKVDVYPGYGWDQIRFVQMSPIYAVANFNDSYAYQSCIDIVPRHENEIELNSVTIDAYDVTNNEYSSNTVIKGSGDFFIFKGGSYSESFKKIKLQQAQDNSITLRNEINYLLAEVLISNTCPLNSQVKRELLQISDYLQGEQRLLATYAAQLFVKRYGTHFTSRAFLGGSIVEEDFITISKFNHSDTTIRGHKVAAQFSFLKTFNISLGFDFESSTTYTDVEIRAYEKNITRKIISSKGGDVFILGSAMETWLSSLNAKPVILRRYVENLTSIIQSEQIPELSEASLADLREAISGAIETYANMNAIPGCTDRNSGSFNYQANVDDGSCANISQNEQFGGFIRTCTETPGMYRRCSQYTVRNFYTGNDACPLGFQRILLHNTTQVENTYREVCSSCFLIFGECCREVATGYGRRNIVLYGCKADTPRLLYSAAIADLKSDALYAFGGSFTSKKVNPVTGAANCPSTQGFTAAPVTSELKVCLAERAKSISNLPNFGGIYSCLSNHTCPTGYSAFAMDALDGACFLYACLKFPNLVDRRSLYPITLPPFFKIPIRNETLNKSSNNNMDLSATSSSAVTSSLTYNNKRTITGISVAALVFSMITIKIKE